MSARTEFAANISDASGTGVGPWTVAVFFRPTTDAATPAVPVAGTAGPLGATGTASATQINGAGSAVGFTSLGDALARAQMLILDAKAYNPTGGSTGD